MTPGLRERKKADTRRALTDAVLRLSVEHGFDRVSVDQVATAAGVSPRTFFNYFPSREAALIGDPAEMNQRLREAFEARPSTESMSTAAGQALLQALSPELSEPWRLFARTRLAASVPSVSAQQLAAFMQIEAYLAGLVRERTGLAAGHIYPGLVAGAVSLSLRLSVMHWVGVTPGDPCSDLPGRAAGPPPAADLHEHFLTLLGQLDRGLATPAC